MVAERASGAPIGVPEITGESARRATLGAGGCDHSHPFAAYDRYLALLEQTLERFILERFDVR